MGGTFVGAGWRCLSPGAMRVEVVSVCRRPPGWVSVATEDYAKRLTRYLELRQRHVAPGTDALTAAVRRRDEAQRITKVLRPAAHLVALDINGDAISSTELAGWLADWRTRYTDVTLLIGGADGLDASLLERAAQRWSLSRLTLPHLLVQVIVAEQVYRAWSILESHPYHRA